MAGLPPLNQECNEIIVLPQELCILMPGGAELCVQIPKEFPQPDEIVKQLFAQLNSAMAPLAPLFNIIDLSLTIVDCVKGIPEGPTELPPFKTLLECIPNLIEKALKIAAMIPPLSIPFMILGFIDALLVLLEAIVLKLQTLVSELARIVEAETAAAELGSAQLNIIVDCARMNVDAEMQGLNAGFGPIASLLGVINLFLELIGMDPMPSLSDIGQDPGAGLQPILNFIQAMRDVRALIPV
jgi:hypothetical protein